MNAGLISVGYKYLEHIFLCFDCFKQNHFREEDCRLLQVVDLIWERDDLDNVECDYCHKKLVTRQTRVEASADPTPWYKKLFGG